jgi:hypothetical protein
MRLIPLLLVLCVGCTPLHYVKKNPLKAPQPIEAPELTVPTLTDSDCGRFTFDDLTGNWVEGDWTQPGGEIDTIEPGDSHPAVGEEDDLVTCRHLAIAPGWWVVSREARERYVIARNQLTLWEEYSERSAQRSQEEAEAIARLLELSKKRQIQAFLIGAGAGASAVSIVVLSVILSSR